MSIIRLSAALLVPALVGCSPSGVGVLGDGSHVADDLEITALATAADGLAGPTDLAFNPVEPADLWITNWVGQSMVVLVDAGADQTVLEFAGAGGTHFLARPSGIAFASNGFFATSHDTDQKTQGAFGTPGDFMGPTLWEADLETFDAGTASHMDMLHNSPLAKGVAWDEGNAYWVFDGYHSSLTRYDFQDDHGPAGTDHSDGIIERYVEGEVAGVEDVVSNMLMIGDLLYVADTGNQRVAILDTSTGTPGSRITPNYDGGQQYKVDGATITTFVDSGDLAEAGLTLDSPSGLAFDGELLFVGDNANSRVLAFDLDGVLVDWLDLDIAPGGLAGIELDQLGRLYAVDYVGEQILRIAAAK